MKDIIELYIKENYPELEILEIKNPTKDSNYKYKVVLNTEKDNILTYLKDIV